MNKKDIALSGILTLGFVAIGFVMRSFNVMWVEGLFLSAALFLVLSFPIYLYRKAERQLLRLEKRDWERQDQVRSIRQYFIKEQKKNIDIGAERQRLFSFLETHYASQPETLLKEYHASEFYVQFQAKLEKMRVDYPKLGPTSGFDAEALYLLVRSCRPEVMVETGVREGVSSAHILEAMRLNGKGRLHSIDLVTVDSAVPQGYFVESNAKSSWSLIQGDSEKQLPRLLKRLPPVNLFMHDSKHSFDHMTMEYETVYPYFAKNGILASHDVLVPPFEKSAFVEFCKKFEVQGQIYRNLGVALCNQKVSSLS